MTSPNHALMAAFEALPQSSRLNILTLAQDELIRIGRKDAAVDMERHRVRLKKSIELRARIFDFLTAVEPIVLSRADPAVRAAMRPLSHRTVERMSVEPLAMALRQIALELRGKGRADLAERCGELERKLEDAE